MKIKVLVCSADGTQTIEEREVPDDWFAPTANKSASQGGADSAETK